MKKKYLLRLLTLAIYFLPFSFFYAGCEGVAYNQEDAKKLISQDSIKQITRKIPFDDSIVIETKDSNYENSIFYDTIIEEKIDTTSISYHANKFGYVIVEHVMCPTKNTISGIGISTIFVNLFGRICIILSILLSIILLMTEVFFKNKNTIITYIILLNILLIISFLINGIIYKVELKFGVGCLLIFLIVQLYLETKRVKIKT